MVIFIETVKGFLNHVFTGKKSKHVAAQQTVGRRCHRSAQVSISGEFRRYSKFQDLEEQEDRCAPSLVLHIWRVRRLSDGGSVFQLVAQGEGGDALLLQRSCREELQSHVWFGIFVEMHLKKLKKP